MVQTQLSKSIKALNQRIVSLKKSGLEKTPEYNELLTALTFNGLQLKETRSGNISVRNVKYSASQESYINELLARNITTTEINKKYNKLAREELKKKGIEKPTKSQLKEGKEKQIGKEDSIHKFIEDNQQYIYDNDELYKILKDSHGKLTAEDLNELMNQVTISKSIMADIETINNVREMKSYNEARQDIARIYNRIIDDPLFDEFYDGDYTAYSKDIRGGNRLNYYKKYLTDEELKQLENGILPDSLGVLK